MGLLVNSVYKAGDCFDFFLLYTMYGNLFRVVAGALPYELCCATCSQERPIQLSGWRASVFRWPCVLLSVNYEPMSKHKYQKPFLYNVYNKEKEKFVDSLQCLFFKSFPIFNWFFSV